MASLLVFQGWTPSENHDKCIIYLENHIHNHIPPVNNNTSTIFAGFLFIVFVEVGFRIAWANQQMHLRYEWFNFHVISCDLNKLSRLVHFIKAAGCKILGLIAGVRDVPWFSTRTTAMCLWWLINCLHVLHLGRWGVGEGFSLEIHRYLIWTVKRVGLFVGWIYW